MPLFTPEEEKEIQPRGFFSDAEKKTIRVVEKIRKEGSNGKPYFQLKLQEVATGNEVTVTDFALQDALRPLNQNIVLGETKIDVVPTKTGEREYNGKTYDQFSYVCTLAEDVAF